MAGSEKEGGKKRDIWRLVTKKKTLKQKTKENGSSKKLGRERKTGDCSRLIA